VSQTGDLWLLGATVTCPKCRKTSPLERAKLGIAEIPVMVAAGWTEAQKRAYVLADNQLAITGSGWDPELLRLELGELKLSGFDLSFAASLGARPGRLAERRC
jgi:hypothetical protein